MKTPCSQCKLFDNEVNKCFASKQSYSQNGDYVIDGYCRLFSMQEYLFNLDDLNNILEDSKKKAMFKYTLIILFDNKKDSYENLQNTLLSCYDQYSFEDFIILDISGDPGKIGECESLNKLLRGWNETKFIINRTIDDYTNNKELALFSIRNKINQPYFVLLNAGQEINDFSEVVEELNSCNDNYIYWRFHEILSRHIGVYVTKPYKQISSMIIGENDKLFSDKLEYIYNQKNINLNGLLGVCKTCEQPS